MTTHTKGPWAVHKDFKNYVVPADHVARRVGFAVDEAKDLAEFAQQVCEINLLTRRRPASESIANARLIAAAPELLEALKWVADRLHVHMVHSEDLVAHMRACEVISKATGETE